jgi:AcrR family transcriptional regulator
MNPRSRRTAPNETPRNVRLRERRTARTRDALHDAMSALLSERPFEEITVAQLLRRAQVGRATFYAHFQDKHDLLLTGFVRMLEFVTRGVERDGGGEPRRLLPVRELLEHVGSARPLLRLLDGSGQLPQLWRLAALHFARTLERRGRAAIAARFLAGAFLEMLQWWLEQRQPPPAAHVDAQFHALARRVP